MRSPNGDVFFIKGFNKATGVGLDHIDEIVTKIKFEDYDLHKYYTVNIDYMLDDKKREALKLFLGFLSTDK